MQDDWRSNGELTNISSSTGCLLSVPASRSVILSYQQSFSSAYKWTHFHTALYCSKYALAGTNFIRLTLSKWLQYTIEPWLAGLIIKAVSWVASRGAAHLFCSPLMGQRHEAACSLLVSQHRLPHTTSSTSVLCNFFLSQNTSLVASSRQETKSNIFTQQ